nr:hypothetical protein [Tanacetum cinerariifolium]
MRRTRRRRSTQLRPTLLMYRQMILSPQAENTETFETDESASTPSTILPLLLGNVKQGGLNEDPVDYPANGGDNDDNESSDDDDDDDDDDVEKDGEDDEEEEHLSPIDPSVVPIDDPVPSS